MWHQSVRTTGITKDFGAQLNVRQTSLFNILCYSQTDFEGTIQKHFSFKGFVHVHTKSTVLFTMVNARFYNVYTKIWELTLVDNGN